MNQNPIIKAVQDELAKQRDDKATDWCIEKGVYNKEHFAYQAGHEAASARLLSLLEKAVEMAEFYANEEHWSGYKHWTDMMEDSDYEVAKTNTTDEQIEVAGKKAREFLTTLADASGEIDRDGK